jgi:transposase InsO family protein
MSLKENSRAMLLQNVNSGLITLRKASNLLCLSYPQTKRIWAKFKQNGPKGLISKKRGKPSNRMVSRERRAEVASIIRQNYYDMKPLFTSEKLKEKHGINYSSEFIRQLMIEYKLWFPKEVRRKIHQRRSRRECEGELVQMDASDHDWFEGRGPCCHLHLLVDDATSKILGGYFTPEETTEGYFRACLPYFVKKGLPISFYNDKRGTFVVNQGKNKGDTQFRRALKELGVGMILAHSPEAKGRIERVFGTLQERLVWEMRVQGISTIEDANGFLPSFFEEYNIKFSVEPENPFDAHRPLSQNQNLKYILCAKEVRTVTKNLEVQFKSTIYQLDVPRELQKSIRRAKIEVGTTLEGMVFFQFRGKLISYRKYNDQIYIEKMLSLEEQSKSWKDKKRKAHSGKHPWRRRKDLGLDKLGAAPRPQTPGPRRENSQTPPSKLKAPDVLPVSLVGVI